MAATEINVNVERTPKMRTPSAVILPHGRIKPDPYQPRKRFDEEKINHMAETIAESGLYDPLKVRKDPKNPGYYIIVAGERRWRACNIIGLEEISAFIVGDDEDFFMIQVMENLQREALDPMEEAGIYGDLRDKRCLNQIEIGKKVGQYPYRVSEYLQLLRLPQTMKDAVAEGRLKVTAAVKIARACKDQTVMRTLEKQLLRETRGYRGFTLKKVEIAIARRDKPASPKKMRGSEVVNTPGWQLYMASRALLTMLNGIAGQAGNPYPSMVSVQAQWLAMPKDLREKIIGVLEKIQSRITLLKQFLRQLKIEDEAEYDDSI